MTLRQYRAKLREMLLEISPEGDVIADMLLCEALNIERGYLLAHLDDETPRAIDGFISGAVFELSLGKPLQYVLGKCNFYGYDIVVGDGVFIPRSDTEIGVKAALGLLKDGALFADICSGSGCIAKAIAKEKPTVSGYALELSRKALPYTEKNLADCKNVSVRRFDALDEDDYIELAGILERPLDLVICNPPYIPTDDIQTLSAQVGFEPDTALDGGEDGLRYYRIVTSLVPHILKRDGILIYEIGIGQCEDVSSILRSHGYSVAVLRDYGKIDRILVAQRNIQ
ncbi:MAG: peptide chain release factor N(5)-glutamine methyltransferase [Clostridia bacterium]|nr:peptide chain release factor N(5)-glutamine methyltransferase [Clostridia bacterium]MBR6784338.1 peptide chain release factor N(5)-glutamine methyltransferase [Clostridia bacterium]